MQVYGTREVAFQRLLEGAVAVNGEGAVTDQAAQIIAERGIRRYLHEYLRSMIIYLD